jgi:transposase
MSKRTVLISEDIFLYAENSLKQLGSTGKVSSRLQAIVASYKHGIKQVAKVLDISRASIHRWVNLLRENGVDGLCDAGKPARSKLNTEQKNIMKNWLEIKPTLTIKELGVKIKKEFGIELGKSSIHRTLASLGFSHITGRPRYYKGDELRQKEFKKNSKN